MDEYLEHIKDSGQHLMGLISDLLDYSSIEAGKFDLKMDSTNVQELIFSTLSLSQLQLEVKNIKLTTDISEDVQNTVLDVKRIKQVLINLLSNAVKFTPEGGHIDLTVSREPDLSISFCIADTGLGMSTEERPIDLRAEFANFQEAGACGTAAVLSPIGKIWFDGQWNEVGDAGSEVGPTMQKVYDLLVGIQKGELDDKRGWCHEVRV